MVMSSLYLAFAEGEETKLADRHLQQAISTTVPLSQSMGQRIAALRHESKEKWRPASGGPKPLNRRSQRSGDLRTAARAQKAEAVFDV